MKKNALPKTEIESARAVDYELAQKAAKGDIAAFEEIYWKYHRRVFGVCYQMTKSVTEAEDATQKVFLQLFRKIDSFRGESAFSTWLHRLTVNQVLMHFRIDKARKEQTTEDGEMLETGHLHKTKQTVHRVIDRLELDKAIAKLPDGYRKVVILHDIQGFEHDEIAQILGCASGTSKSQLFKARQKLRKMLASDYYGFNSETT